MSVRNSPDPASQLVVSGDEGGDDAPVVANGHRSPNATGEAPGQASPVHSIEGDGGTLPDAPATKENVANGGDEDANSEAETLIDSPVKKKEAEKQKNVVKAEKPQKSRIGSLPVPGDDDEDGDSTASALESREVSVGKGNSFGDAKEDVEMMDDDSDKENGSELSSVESSPSDGNSRASSRSRAISEIPQDARNGASGSPNPRKRKHRASSMSLPSSKRRSMDPPKRTRLRGMHSEDVGGHTEASLSPKRGHRRAVSTQSALDGTNESSGRKRKGATTYPGREASKSAKAGWEESDASSETTSRGQEEGKRPQRGVVRSTSTPGKPGGREHKRHVNKYGFTRLAEACEEADLDLVKELLDKDPEAIEVPEFAGNKPLQIAAVYGNAEIVSYLIEKGCQIDSANLDKDTPLIDAAENGHLETVKILLEAGVDPLRQNLKGQQALDVITDDTDDAPGIRAALHQAIDQWNSSEAKQRREEEEEQRHRAGPSKELHLMARTYENLMRLVQINDRNGVSEFLAARVPVDNGVIAAAAKTGDLYLVNMLLAEMTDKKASQRADKPMLSVLGSGHFEMVKALTELDNFNPLYRSRTGKSWTEIAEEKDGPNVRLEKELLQRLYDNARGAMKERRSSSPVTKRDGVKRRLQPPEPEEDSDEEDGTRQRSKKKKNSRRLMSRKDMRAVSSKGTMSDSSDEDAEGEPDVPAMIDATSQKKEEGDTEMKPPETPNTRRRLRSKSISSPPELSPKSLRKRSNSTRDVAEKAMPTLDEKGEEKDSGSDGIVLGDVQDPKKQKGDAAKLALDEAKRLDEKRRKEEEAEAEAKRVEEELKMKQEEERKADEERKAAEAKAAQEARRKEEEAERVRKAEEERIRHEQEIADAKKNFHSQLLEALPTPFSHVIDPDSGFRFETSSDRDFLLRQFTPLLAFAGQQSSTPTDNLHVLNLQAAPLLGKIGIELFGSGNSSIRSSLLESWMTESRSDVDVHTVHRILSRLDWSPAPAFTDSDEEMQDAELSFEEELKKTAARYNAFVGARELLQDNIFKHGLRRVKLVDVMDNLHPLLKDAPICVEFFQPPLSHLDRLVKNNAPLKQDFVRSIKDSWAAGPFKPAFEVLGGKVEVPAVPGGGLGSLTDVLVVHEKRP